MESELKVSNCAVERNANLQSLREFSNQIINESIFGLNEVLKISSSLNKGYKEEDSSNQIKEGFAEDRISEGFLEDINYNLLKIREIQLEIQNELKNLSSKLLGS